ncbi:MAG: hypothetical protein HY873_12545 [Chloroflexi bacterium]|nr:hypothetical protein [Chloroflexota bacterium]
MTSLSSAIGRACGLAMFITTGVAVGLACASASKRVAAVVHADDIPTAYTPGGGWRGAMPPPVLAACTEPPAPGAPDLRGLWKAYAVEQGGKPVTNHPLNDHIERIEQCGDRVVITSEPVIHDMRADGILEHGVNDVAAANFTPIRVAAIFSEGRLELYPGGIQPGAAPLVTREIVDGELILNYVVFKVTMRRMHDAADGPRSRQ